MGRFQRGEAQALVSRLADGTRTFAEIASEGGFSREYVVAAVRRLGVRHLIVSRAYKRKRTGKEIVKDFMAAKVDHQTRQAILDRANATGLLASEIAGLLLRVAVEVGDLDTHFSVPCP